MTGEIEALGNLVTGTLLARAVEPQAGEADKGQDGQCRNCGARLSGPYCAACGQKAHVHRTLAEFGHDLAHSVFHFDGKIWRTLPLLAWRPGELTRRYVYGERAKFVSPFALFLFSVFLMVAIFSWAGPSGPSLEKPVPAAEAAKALSEDQAQLREEIAKLETLKAKAPAPWIDRALVRTQDLLDSLSAQAEQPTSRMLAERKIKIQQRLAETELARLEAARADAVAAKKPTGPIDEEIRGLKLGTTILGTATRSLGPEGVQADRVKINLGWERLNALVRHAAENPQLMLYKIQSNAYKFSWALIPISVPFVWLLFFWRRDVHLFDHAVFVTYSIAFMTLLATLCVLAIQLPQTETIGGLLLVLYPPVHVYRQLRAAYGLSRLGALWRTGMLGAFSLTALVLFAIFVLAVGLSG